MTRVNAFYSSCADPTVDDCDRHWEVLDNYDTLENCLAHVVELCNKVALPETDKIKVTNANTHLVICDISSKVNEQGKLDLIVNKYADVDQESVGEPVASEPEPLPEPETELVEPVQHI